MRKYFFPIPVILLLACCVLGQDDWHTYPFRDLATVVRGEQELYDKTGKADLIISAKPFPSKTRVTFTGKKRAVGRYGKRFITIWNESRGMPASNVDLLQEEFLFLERGNEYWMPVLMQTAKVIERDLQAGDEVIIYYFYLGGYDAKSLQAKDTAETKGNPETDEMRMLFAVERVETIGSSFAPTRLADVIERSEEMRGKTEDIWFDPRQVKGKVRVVFTGEVRDISGRRKQLRDLWFEKRGAPPGTSQLMQSEALFREGDKEHWIILRNQTREHLRSYVKKGDAVHLNTILAGTIRNSGRIEWIFMSGEYSTF